MNIDIEEEEREFLERLCVRAELYCKMNIFSPNSGYSPFEKDLKKIQDIIIKFKKVKDDH